MTVLAMAAMIAGGCQQAPLDVTNPDSVQAYAWKVRAGATVLVGAATAHMTDAERAKLCLIAQEVRLFVKTDPAASGVAKMAVQLITQRLVSDTQQQIRYTAIILSALDLASGFVTVPPALAQDWQKAKPYLVAAQALAWSALTGAIDALCIGGES